MQLKKWLVWGIVAFSGLVLGFQLFVFSRSAGDPGNPDERYGQARDHFYKNFSMPLPAKLDFAGEAVPLDVFYVRESLDRELLVNSYWHSSTFLMFKRSFRYFPMIDSVLKAQAVPRDFRYLVMIESSLENVVSPAGAAGFWQFMKSTGTAYGLEINTEIDERYHVLKSTVAACKYLREAKTKLGSWTLAAASYNAGMATLEKSVKTQHAKTYYDLNLTKETLRYVYRILALKLIYESPVTYGFYLRTNDMYPPVPVYKVTVDSAVASWGEFAEKHHVTYRLLKEMNPWLIGISLTNKERKKYQIELPLPGYENYSQLMKNINQEQLFNDTLTIDGIR